MRLLALGFGLSALACLSAGVRKAESREPKAISISGFKFQPAELTVAVGDSVVWRNDDQLQHTTTADSGAWSSPEMKGSERFTFVAGRAGRFPYHCAAHPVMRAVLIVRE